MSKLYRHYDSNGELLYIGISLSAIRRLGEHAGRSHWYEDIVRVEIDTYPSIEAARDAERVAIKRERPKYNLKLRNDPEEEWQRKKRERRERQLEVAKSKLFELPVMPIGPDQTVILRPKTVSAMVGLSIRHIRRLASQGRFPPIIKLGECSAGFLGHEVKSWIDQRAAAR